MGPSDTPYDGGNFILTADFPDNYPNQRPEVRFLTKIYHLNVDPYNGHISICILNGWRPQTPFSEVLSSIFLYFYYQYPMNPYSPKMAHEYMHNRTEFDRKAREWTGIYALWGEDKILIKNEKSQKENKKFVENINKDDNKNNIKDNNKKNNQATNKNINLNNNINKNKENKQATNKNINLYDKNKENNLKNTQITNKNININKNINNNKQNNQVTNKKIDLNRDNNKEKPIAIIFNSTDELIHYAVVCYESNNFITVEQEVFKEYPELKNKNIVYLYGGDMVNKNATLRENNIKHNSNLIIAYID